MAMAMLASVTVSIGELTTGVASRMFRVSWLLRSTLYPTGTNFDVTLRTGEVRVARGGGVSLGLAVVGSGGCSVPH